MRANQMTDDFPTSGRLAAVDYGTVRIGIAVCDPDRILVSPLEVYQVRDPKHDAEFFRNVAKQERISGFVVGLPIHCDGGESQKSLESRKFARWLHVQTELPIRLFDERFSTAAAKERLSRRSSDGTLQRRLTKKKTQKRLDAIAAMVLLETFLGSLPLSRNPRRATH